MTPRAGDLAPDFDALADDGRHVRLRELRGRWVVLYFFPRSSTPGCSIEARGFETALPEFERLGAQVIGVSTDTEARAALMRERCGLTFPLLPDAGRQICRSYGVMGGLGSLLGLASRQTFVIGPDGLIAHHWAQVNPSGHAGEVLRVLHHLQSSGPARSGDAPSTT